MATAAGRLRQTLVGLTVGTWSTALQLGFLSAAALAIAVTDGPLAGSYGVIAVVAYSLYVAAADVFRPDETSQDFDVGWLAERAISVLAAIYFNVLILVTIVLALAAGPEWGVAVATLYPIADARAVELGVPLTVSGVFVVLAATIVGLSSLSQSVAWRDLRPPRPQLSPLGGVRHRQRQRR